VRLDKVQNPCRYDCRFTAAGSCDDDSGTCDVIHGFFLVSIEFHIFSGLSAKTSGVARGYSRIDTHESAVFLKFL
jgi:hypothetical protein